MKCPRCRLLNPDSAQRCDCGYDFASGQVLASYSTREDSGEDAGALLILTWIFSLLGGLIGLALAYHIVGAQVDGRPKYNEKSRASAGQARVVALLAALGIALIRFALRG